MSACVRGGLKVKGACVGPLGFEIPLTLDLDKKKTVLQLNVVKSPIESTNCIQL